LFLLYFFLPRSEEFKSAEMFDFHAPRILHLFVY
jgi:hypothetical protein